MQKTAKSDTVKSPKPKYGNERFETGRQSECKRVKLCEIFFLLLLAHDITSEHRPVESSQFSNLHRRVDSSGRLAVSLPFALAAVATMNALFRIHVRDNCI